MRILFLDLDTLRPDHLGCYGYHRNTSPNIDSIARRGTRFENYYCSDAPCLPSRAALWSGRYGIHTGVVGHGGTAADMRLDGATRGFTDYMGKWSLPAVLQRSGLHMVSISPFAQRHGAWWFGANFNEIYNTGKGGNESAEDVTPVALDWIRANAHKDDWFLHLNYWDAHTPYRAPASFGNPFKDEPLPAWITPEVLHEHQSAVGPHCAREIAMYDNSTDPRFPRHPGEIRNMDDLRVMIDGYDCGIRYMDQHIGMVLDALEKNNALRDTVIIISSDHAENMGELGIYGEHATADYATCRIPMIISWPGHKRGHVDEGIHLNIDLLPTLAHMLGQQPSDVWDGRSYHTALDGFDASREYAVISQCAHVCQRAVRYNDWHYIRTYHDGYHLFPKEMLFNIKMDRYEQMNLAPHYRDICNEANAKLSEWHDEMMARSDSDIDPLWTVMREGGPHHARGHLKKYCEFLKATDRGWAVPELMKRHPGEFE